MLLESFIAIETTYQLSLAFSEILLLPILPIPQSRSCLGRVQPPISIPALCGKGIYFPIWEPLQHFSYDSLPSLGVIDPTGWSPLVRTLRSWLESSRVSYLPALPHGWGLSNALKYSHRLTIARYGGNIALATNAGHKYLSHWQWNWSQNCIQRGQVYTFLLLTLPNIEGEFPTFN